MDFLSFDWLGLMLVDFFAWLRGWQLVDGVSMFSFLLAVCLLIVAIRGMLLKR